jgi:RNA polymerase sigma-70 factor (ECF subfamily)
MTKTKKIPQRKQVRDEDYELVQAINAGETRRFEELVQRYEQKLYNFSLRMCRDVADAEDLVQETFLNVFRYLKDFRYETKFKNWLYRIAASTCIKKRRKSKFAPDRELSLDEYSPNEEKLRQADKVPEWALIPLEKLLNEELLEVLNQGILALPEKYRVIVILRDLEGFSTAETAQILSISPANVKVRLHRARLYLRDQLKGYFKHDE